ncbi:hypothetical protein [Spirulina subsalsa]|uniref:hypothetical protein n=1 Tax=Spirulina subsalsa TaxID=54311 RepID=UPI000310A169|nr:hypothetical protein [Spirulina subsalsa]
MKVKKPTQIIRTDKRTLNPSTQQLVLFGETVKVYRRPLSQKLKAGGVLALLSVIFGAVDPVLGNPSSPPLQTLGNASKQWITQASEPPSTPLDIEPEILEESPVLQRWSEEIPDVLHDIRHDPSFKTRVRLGYSQFPSTRHHSGWNIGVEDVFLGKTGLTVSAEYQGTFKGDSLTGDQRRTWGGDLRYYVLPLGSRVNIAPVLGYRNITTGAYQTDGVNVGATLKLIPSRTGAADLSLTQTFVSPGSGDEVGITTLSVGYAITRHLRLSTDLQKQNSVAKKDSRVGIVLEWMP